jgi:hypothetical protein
MNKNLTENDKKIVEILRVFCSNVIYYQEKKEEVKFKTFTEIYKLHSNNDLKTLLSKNEV